MKDVRFSYDSTQITLIQNWFPWSQVNNNFFLAVVPITSFDSDTLLNTFPKANRDGVVQITEDLKKQISRWVYLIVKLTVFFVTFNPFFLIFISGQEKKDGVCKICWQIFISYSFCVIFLIWITTFLNFVALSCRGIYLSMTVTNWSFVLLLEW
jgi:hypothetical protein